MDVILLERVPKLGQMGDVVRVRNGFARNFLLPKGKALRASETNRQRFEREKTQLEARNLEARKEAEAVGDKLAGQSFTVIRQAAEGGQLYGSVATRDIADTLQENGFTIARSQVLLNRPIKTIGMHEIAISLHPEVEVPITMNVARTPDEAERQAGGEDLTRRVPYGERPEPEEEAPEPEELFEHPDEVALGEEGEAEGEGETEAERG
ncbi:MAG TPA: 50S ribosomal protein L9 [Afifellaceae bacterium]|nr:50S ribosomal protein L9 [Afifellaceae bacterium]